jgi:hypothetical protein
MNQPMTGRRRPGLRTYTLASREALDSCRTVNLSGCVAGGVVVGQDLLRAP